MKLIVGLGNPGKTYEDTRHNVGFKIIDNFAIKNNLNFKEKNNGLYAEFNINNEKVFLLKPMQFMNLSGQVVSSFIKFYKIEIEDVLIIYDDVNYELGTFKLKFNGSSGGHNGMKNIIECLKTENIKRMKVGISKKKSNLTKFVLKKFGIREKKVLHQVITQSEKVIEDFVQLDFEKLMNKYN